MNNEPLEREPIDRMRARLEALLKANAAPRCGARSKRTGKPCQGAAMPNGRCKLHGGKSTGPRTECVQMPVKIARSTPRPSVRITRGAGSGQHLASVLQERWENANIDAGLGFIWRISVRLSHSIVQRDPKSNRIITKRGGIILEDGDSA
jgi:hypothetical protein